ncbi:MAG: hypothetical protein U0931_38245 [Vulcanimicrobiota bacterium]
MQINSLSCPNLLSPEALTNFTSSPPPEPLPNLVLDRVHLEDPEAQAGQAGPPLAALLSNFQPQGLDIDMQRHTQARLEHTNARLNSPSLSPQDRQQLLREQAQFRSQLRGLTADTSELPTPEEAFGRSFDGVRSVTGDIGPVGRIQRIRVADTREGLGRELGGAAGQIAASGPARMAGARLGANLGLRAGVAVGVAMGGGPVIPLGLLGGLGGGLIGWLGGGYVGDAAGGAAGAAVGRQFDPANR